MDILEEAAEEIFGLAEISFVIAYYYTINIESRSRILCQEKENTFFCLFRAVSQGKKGRLTGFRKKRRKPGLFPASLSGKKPSSPGLPTAAGAVSGIANGSGGRICVL